MNQHLSRLELALSARFSECSVVAAEVAKMAQQSVLEYGRPATIFVIDEELSPQPTDVYFVPISRPITDDDGRTVTIGLYKPSADKDSERVTMGAVTRGDIVLPLAQFTRRTDSPFCDYVQIGQEMDDANFVITQEHEVSRRQIVELLRNLLDVSPALVNNEATLYYDRATFWKIANYVASLAREGFSGHSLFDKSAMEAWAVLEAIVDYGSDIPYDSYKISKCIDNSSQRAKRHLEKCRDILTEFMHNPSLAVLESGKLPGSRHSELMPLFRAVVLSRLAERGGNYDPDKVGKLLQVLDVRAKLDKILGETSPTQERIFSRLSQIAFGNKSAELVGVIKDLPFARTVGDIALKATVRRDSATTFIVRVDARPEAMDADFEHVYDYVLDRTANNADLTDTEAAELDAILNQVK